MSLESDNREVKNYQNYDQELFQNFLELFDSLQFNYKIELEQYMKGSTLYKYECDITSSKWCKKQKSDNKLKKI